MDNLRIVELNTNENLIGGFLIFDGKEVGHCTGITKKGNLEFAINSDIVKQLIRSGQYKLNVEIYK